jgi:hypothetical protein
MKRTEANPKEDVLLRVLPLHGLNHLCLLCTEKGNEASIKQMEL